MFASPPPTPMKFLFPEAWVDFCDVDAQNPDPVNLPICIRNLSYYCASRLPFLDRLWVGD